MQDHEWMCVCDTGVYSYNKVGDRHKNACRLTSLTGITASKRPHLKQSRMPVLTHKILLWPPHVQTDRHTYIHTHRRGHEIHIQKDINNIKIEIM